MEIDRYQSLKWFSIAFSLKNFFEIPLTRIMAHC